MKKILVLLLSVFLLSGCTDISKSSIEVLLDTTANSNLKIYNTYRKGYKFYLPSNMYVANSKNFNETIKNKFDSFYLYIDLISYLNNSPIEKKKSPESYYFNYLQKDDITGYIEIKKTQDGKYLVEIVYNYAKIEVIVVESRLNMAITDAMCILSSIEYNDSFLKNLSDESLLNYKEEAVDIFKKGDTSESSTFVQYIDEFDSEDEDRLPDYDLIN